MGFLPASEWRHLTAKYARRRCGRSILGPGFNSRRLHITARSSGTSPRPRQAANGQDHTGNDRASHFQHRAAAADTAAKVLWHHLCLSSRSGARPSHGESGHPCSRSPSAAQADGRRPALLDIDALRDLLRRADTPALAASPIATALRVHSPRDRKRCRGRVVRSWSPLSFRQMICAMRTPRDRSWPPGRELLEHPRSSALFVAVSFGGSGKVYSIPNRSQAAWENSPQWGRGVPMAMACAERRDRKNAEDSSEPPAESQERARRRQGSRRCCEAAHAQHPVDTGGGANGRIAAWGEGVEAGLRPLHAEACGEDQGREPTGRAPTCKAHDEDGARQIRGADHPGWVSPIHAHPIRIAPIVAPIWNIAVTLAAAVIVRPASFIRGRQPSRQQIDDDQAHEIGDPERDRCRAVSCPRAGGRSASSVGNGGSDETKVLPLVNR